jgi:GNAT superfamily N-acetyltransferase
MILDEQEILDVVERHMQTWRCFKRNDHTFAVKLLGDREACFGFDGTCEVRHMNHRSARWRAQIKGDVFYLLEIWIPQRRRHKGHGQALYEIMERIAADLACRQIRQTPSGWTARGEDRVLYLERRDWVRDGLEVYKNLAFVTSEDQ